MLMRNVLLPLILAVSAMLTGCTTSKGEAGDEKRQAIQSMRDDALAGLYHQKPEAKAEIETAPGYAVFSNTGLTLLSVVAGDGYGMPVDNHVGNIVYMTRGQVSAALGLGLKDFRAVFVFMDQATPQQFVDKGREFSGEADAGLQSGDKGGEVEAAGNLKDQLRFCQFTESGIAIKPSLPLTKYRKYDELNQPAPEAAGCGRRDHR